MDVSLALRVEEVCTRFERAWRDGPPRIEDYLAGWSGYERAALVRALIAIDVERRRKAGEAVSPSDYRSRFPDLPPGSEDATGAYSPSQGQAVAVYPPGTVLAGRYRIVALLGRGGMGEVYRADDLALGQPVALKFLPGAVAGDPDRVARFRQEAVSARRITHPHVCRVHDIGEADGRAFLSMEYVAGQDLSSLRRSVGRLAEEKALEIARQLCAALAAVHEQGLLHRDLKPANVLLDERGRIRLADFGLATAADRVSDVGSGTPLYMAPEQLTGREVTVQSDLYSLGLVLYELFTGRSAFPPEAPLRARLHAAPVAPSLHIPGLGPAIESVILRCLEPVPANRPRSALDVLAALSGGDLIAAAREAEVALSPDEVARAGGKGALRSAVGIACLAGVVLGLLGVVFLAPATMIVGVVLLPKSPEVLRGLAVDYLAALGYGDRPGDRVEGFLVDASVHPPTLGYWYRGSAVPLVILDGPTFGHLDRPPGPNHPPVGPGMHGIRLNPHGRLVSFHAFLDGDVTPSAALSDWGAVFHLAGLEPSCFREVENVASMPLPPVPCDRQHGWEGVDPDGRPIRVSAATCRDRLVWFVAGSPDLAWGGPRYDPPGRIWFESLVAIVLFGCLGLAMVWALDHWRRGVIDRARAFRFAAFFLAAEGLVWALRVHHVAGRAEMDLVFVGLAKVLLIAAFVWLFYAALEPHARRVRPDTLVAWNRLLGGNWRDSLVGQAVLIGVLIAVLERLFYLLLVALPGWVGWPAALPDGLAEGSWGLPLPVLLGTGPAVAAVLRFVTVSVFEAFLISLTLLIVLGMMFPRPRWLAGLLYCSIFTVLFAAALSHRGVLALAYGLAVVVTYQLLNRVGVLALATCLLVTHLLQFPLTSDPGSWYAPQSAVALGTILALAGYGFVVSRGRAA